MKYGLSYIVLAVIVFFFLTCTNKKNDDIVHLVKEWGKKDIIFPNDQYFTLYGKDTVLFPEHSQYTILSYVDSAGCISCKLRLPLWKEFIHRLDSSYPRKVSVLLFLHSKNKAELLHILAQDSFDYPVCIDEDDKLNRLNHFPSNMSFQTFLLDKDNKVLAIGNPILNPKVKDLYLKIISENDVVQNVENDIVLTNVNIDRTLLSLGSFDWHQQQKVFFYLKNVGVKPLVIQDIMTSCGCISVDYLKEPIRSNDSLQLCITYKAEHPEHFNKTITVYCNVEFSPIVLKITGTAE